MAASVPGLDTFLLGYCDDARALLALLDVEAPWRVRTLCVLDPDPLVARALRERGVTAKASDLRDADALRAAGVERATTVVAFEARTGGSMHELGRLLRWVAPSARFHFVPAGASFLDEVAETRHAP